MNIQPLFPTPVGFLNYDKPFSEEELTFIKSLDTRKNIGNSTSVDSYVLNNALLSNLKSFIVSSLEKFFYETYNPIDSVKIKLTQSWVNYSSKGQFHHNHCHPNSIISGVFYINANKFFDKITFFKNSYIFESNHGQIKYDIKDFNTFNSNSWWFPVNTGDLIIFPSNLIHGVDPIDHDDTRISISFNSFVEGNLVNEDNLTLLNLNISNSY